MAEASQAPETKVWLSGDRERDMTYLGRGITGPGDKGLVVRKQEKGHHVRYSGRGLTRPRSKGPVVRGKKKGHDVLWQTVLAIRIRIRRIRMFFGLPDPDH